MLVAMRMQEPALLLIGVALASACTSSAFVSVGPIVGAVAPYRMRTQAFALVPVFIFLMGGFFGGLLAGALSDAHGERTALTIVAPIAGTIGGLLFMYGSRFLKRDISLAVEELLEEQAEIKRMSAHPDEIPVLQIHNLDFSYGPVQVLFDVGFEVTRGEVLALLGTNGAGKSTLLRAISGLGIPDRGVVRLNGRTLTYVDAEVRFRQGIVQLRGGAGVFPELSVGENLHASLLTTKISRPRAPGADRPGADDVPRAREPRGRCSPASSRAGSSRCCALAMALVHEPEILLIDELSLGLAPLVVEELLGVVAGPEGARADDDHRRAVVERRARLRRPRRVHGEGAGALRRSGAGAGRARRPRPSGLPRRRGRLSGVLGLVVTQQAIFYGVVFGLIYAVFAAGFVLVYRSTGILNFAQGEIGAFGVAIFALFHVQYGVPYWLAFAFAVVATAVIGMVIELTVVRRLFNSPRLVLLIATVGVAQLLLFLRISLPNIDAGGELPAAVHGSVASRPARSSCCRARSWC